MFKKFAYLNKYCIVCFNYCCLLLANKLEEHSLQGLVMDGNHCLIKFVSFALCLQECENDGICLENTISWTWLSEWKYVNLPTIDTDLSSCKLYLHLCTFSVLLFIVL